MTLLEVGRVAKPHGLKGQVVVAMSTNRPAERLVRGALLSTDRGDLRVVAAAPHQNRWLVTFEGVVDRDSADSLRGVALMAEPLEEDGTLWVHELIGAQVVDVAGRHLGSVEAIEASPASDLLVLPGERLVPLVFVTERREDGTVVIDPPPGLLDDDIEPT